MNFLKTYLYTVFFLFLFACNQINNPLKDRETGTCGDETQPIPIRKILVEDYTGHRCPNCPDAARIINEIHDDYCDHIIPVALHVSFFAAPHEPDFPEDFRTETGNTLDEFYGISNQGLPGGLVNRREFNGSLVLGRDIWLSAVDVLYSKTPDANIVIESNYNNNDSSVTANITVEFLNNIEESINLGLYVTEDSIIAPQQDGSDYVENYVHRHMLRKGLNGAFGEKILNSANKDDIFEKTFTFKIDKNWNIKHLELIAFLSKNTDGEIIQAESEPVKISN